ncbi:MAG: hypothetical protein IKV28_03185 [Bacteroidales bacterium]|nr:hypothetical protein [Bacteroidales bacterium]
MQPEDILQFADTLASGFSRYSLFQWVCGKQYDAAKMRLFWKVLIASFADRAICIADSKEVNSVLVYIRPKTKEPSVVEYLKVGGLTMLWKLGIRSIFRLLRIEYRVQQVAKRYRGENDGYIQAFATRLDKQGQNYGKPLIKALLHYLDLTGEGCYLETFKLENVGLYEHFSFQLKGRDAISSGNLTLYAMSLVRELRKNNQTHE